jgi:GMP synthase (glutamine-hydrolysing)
MKRLLILQVRPEDETANSEYKAFMKVGGLAPDQVHRVRLEQGPMPKLNLANYAGVVVGGGPSDVSTAPEKKGAVQRRFELELHSLLSQVIAHDFPYFGTCYGLGILANHLGGMVSKERYGEPVHAVTINVTEAGTTDPLTSDLPVEFRAFVGHHEACQAVPPRATLLARGQACPVQMIRVKQNIYATQFHPEADGPEFALRIREYKLAGYFPPDDADRLIAQALEEKVSVPTQIFRRFVERTGLVTAVQEMP